MTVEQSCLANRPIPELTVVRHPEFLSSFDISQAYTSKDRGFSSFTLYFPTENNNTGKLKGGVPLLVSTQTKAYRSRMPVNFSSLCSQLMVRQTLSTTEKKKIYQTVLRKINISMRLMTMTILSFYGSTQ